MLNRHVNARSYRWVIEIFWSIKCEGLETEISRFFFWIESVFPKFVLNVLGRFLNFPFFVISIESYQSCLSFQKINLLNSNSLLWVNKILIVLIKMYLEEKVKKIFKVFQSLSSSICQYLSNKKTTAFSFYQCQKLWALEKNAIFCRTAAIAPTWLSRPHENWLGIIAGLRPWQRIIFLVNCCQFPPRFFSWVDKETCQQQIIQSLKNCRQRDEIV